jgi:hypothetical protein
MYKVVTSLASSLHGTSLAASGFPLLVKTSGFSHGDLVEIDILNSEALCTAQRKLFDSAR